MLMTDIKETLHHVLCINVRDAQELVRLFTAHGDQENLKRAQADLDKWKTKLDQFEAKEAMT